MLICIWGVIKEENYSIQAKNLLDFLIQDYLESLKSFHQDNYYLHEIKKFRFNINNRIRKLLDIAEVKNNFKDNFYHIIVFNSEYNGIIKTELDNIPLTYKEEGQNIFVNKKKLTYNQLMTIVDSIEGFKNKIQENAFIEWQEVYEGHFYGTLKSEIERISNEKKTIIFDVDVEGGLNIKKQYQR